MPRLAMLQRCIRVVNVYVAWAKIVQIVQLPNVLVIWNICKIYCLCVAQDVIFLKNVKRKDDECR